MYKYEEEKSQIFTEEGQVFFLKVRDRCQYMLRTSGCFMMEKVINECPNTRSWITMACVDRLVELKELTEIKYPDNTFGQYRIFRDYNL